MRVRRRFRCIAARSTIPRTASGWWRRCSATHGRVDYLINNAGITIDKTLRKMTVDDWHRVLNVNLFGSFCMIKAVLEHMIERGSGRIVNISSLTGQTGNVGQANYAASKAGLFGLTMSLALELARRGITVNAIAPGFIETDMVAAIPAAQLEKYVERIPVRRMGTPDEVAHLVKFLARRRFGVHYRRDLQRRRRVGSGLVNEPPTVAAEEFAYGFDVAGLDMASLGESLRAVVAEAMADPARMTTWASDVMLADQTIGMNMLLRFMQEPVDPSPLRPRATSASPTPPGAESAPGRDARRLFSACARGAQARRGHEAA